MVKHSKMPSQNMKPRCQLSGCRKFVASVVGKCTFCSSDFCGVHRLPESHECAKLDCVRDEDKARNTEKLRSEATKPANRI